MTEAARGETITWLVSGDRIMRAEALKRLAPRRTAPPPPLTTTELLQRIGEDPTFPLKAANALAAEFGDHASFRGFESRLRVHDPDALVEAYRQASGPKARNRGAIFMHALKRTCIDVTI